MWFLDEPFSAFDLLIRREMQKETGCLTPAGIPAYTARSPIPSGARGTLL